MKVNFRTRKFPINQKQQQWESFDQPFSKGCEFLRQSLKSRSAERETSNAFKLATPRRQFGRSKTSPCGRFSLLHPAPNGRDFFIFTWKAHIFCKTVYNSPKMWYNRFATQSRNKHSLHIYTNCAIFYLLIKMSLRFLCFLCYAWNATERLCRSNGATFLVRSFGCALF